MKPLKSLQGDMLTNASPDETIKVFELVSLLLDIIHFQRTGNLQGYLQAVHEFLPLCFARNRHNYARNLSYHDGYEQPGRNAFRFSGDLTIFWLGVA